MNQRSVIDNSHFWDRPNTTWGGLRADVIYEPLATDWEGRDPPGNGCEVFCGKIPRDLYEDELIPLFEKCGTIWDLRLMMDPMTGLNR